VRGEIFAHDDGEVLVLSDIAEDGRFRRFVSEAGDSEIPADVIDGSGGTGMSAMIERAASQAGIESALVRAVIAVESGGKVRAVSPKGAGGLMQLMPRTARRYGVTNVFSPEQNIRGGAQYLSDLLVLFDQDLRLALAAYNAGEAAVIRFGRAVPPFRETRSYVNRVIKTYRRLRASQGRQR
jgi:soluble lytic murein transglycosylase-like protein